MMKKWTRNMLLMPVLLVQALSSCSLIDEPEYDDPVRVKASLAFTVSSANNSSTRMTDNVVQEQPAEGQSYRGLGDVYMIPFIISGDQVTATDQPQWVFDNDSQASSPSPYVPKTGDFGGFYLFKAYSLMRGINAFLVYGKAKEISGVSGKDAYGSLILPDIDVNLDLRTLRFKLDPVYTKETPPAEATLLAEYLNDIAQTEGWSHTSDSFLFFTVLNNEENNMLAGSSTSVMAHVNALYELIYDSETSELRTAILGRIQSPGLEELTLTNNGKTDADWRLTDITVNGKHYPSSEGLPDGAAALRWVEQENHTYKFEPRIERTPQDNINNIGRFAYPAELFYRANSRIDTSNDAVEENVYQDQSNWDVVCNQYEHRPGSVTIYTKSVAIHDPLQYAVGRLKINMKATAETLKDSKGKDVSLTSDAFPLTGIIISNQHPVDFNFKPVLENGVASHVDDRFIYDSQVKKSDNTYYYLSTTGQDIPSTLVLQTYDTGEGNDKKGAEEVNIVMEFQNNSGQAFSGKSCIIYPGKKFYLIGKVDPLEATSAGAAPEAVGRVFTQDHVTTVNTKVQSLANAYNVLPDLIGGRLELGIELVSSWVQAETTNVILK